MFRNVYIRSCSQRGGVWRSSENQSLVVLTHLEDGGLTVQMCLHGLVARTSLNVTVYKTKN